ncbi:reverse transcriptase domain-containing protein [Tanacetum coccineum]
MTPILLWRNMFSLKLRKLVDEIRLRFFEKEFPTIVYNEALTSELEISFEPTVSRHNVDEVNWKMYISLSESDDEDYIVIYDKDSFSYKIFSASDSKLDKDNDDDKIDIKYSSRVQRIENKAKRYEVAVTAGQLEGDTWRGGWRLITRINVPFIDVLVGMPYYGKFLKELVSNKNKLEQISAAFLSGESSVMIQNKVPPKLGSDLGVSINLMPYSLYAKLSLDTLKPTRMSVRLADKSFQYPIGIDKNMLVEIGKFTFPIDFVILEIEKDSKVPLILGRPFLHTFDAVIRVKQKQLNLGVGTERMTFHMDSAMKNSYLNDDTCFSIDVIDEILEGVFDALLNEGSKILYSIDGTPLEDRILAEFFELISMNIEENSEPESDNEEPSFKKITFNTDYKIKTSLEEPPTDLELKPLPDHLEYVFLEEPSFHPVIISSQLSEENINELVSILKNHKQSFDWKTTDIPKFDIEIKDKKGTKNVVVDHLSRIENDETSDDSEVDDNFPGETLMEITTKVEPWFADFANYLAGDVIPKGMTYQQKNKFFSDLKNYFWEEPYLFKNCNPDLIAAGEKRMFQLHELDELRHQAYENSRLYKERTKVWHDRKLKMRKEFKHGHKVLLFHSKYKFKQPKLRSRLLGPYVVKHQYPSGYVKLYGKDEKTFIVNGHRLKLYHEEDNDPREELTSFPKTETSNSRIEGNVPLKCGGGVK